MPEHLEIEVKLAKQDPGIDQDIRKMWEKSSYTCPECHGVLLQLKEGDRERFRCHTGHAFSADGLLASITESKWWINCDGKGNPSFRNQSGYFTY